MRSVFAILAACLLATQTFAFMVANQVRVSSSIASSSLFMSDSAKKSGTVKWFNSLKGYGFIVPDDGTTDIFVHQSEIQSKGFRSLADGETVEFIPQNEPNGRVKATKVTGPGGAQVQGAPFRPRSDDDY
eukprot:CAMPEP_0170232352 /NCGR_PEP_ID=MMETSP0116_2-20130129/15917_1 /TAXON_ID=400756 /ORGANISM="Durinskia baltica, Strain CSIRO CS-38" /LENGTH=129 /DNA_ID=CAMNT_0010483137 /DNA_START=82 /DNA_END=471 /DNA_ORIENTATION=-